MRLSKIGIDYVAVNEEVLSKIDFNPEEKVHILKLDFKEPNAEKMEQVFKLFKRTRRFVVSNNIKFYNGYLKYTNKKYYVENLSGIKLITFFRRNNKVLLNFENLHEAEKEFMFEYYLEDILSNVEVIYLSKTDYNKHKDKFFAWNGNVIVEGYYE
jgi:hypothetical protein